jgi:hypothetical protein
MNKRDLSERDICSQFIGPAIEQGGWDRTTQVREEVSFTKGRIIVRGKLVSRGKAKRADYILYYKPNIPIAIVEAKDNSHSVGGGCAARAGDPQGPAHSGNPPSLEQRIGFRSTTPAWRDNALSYRWLACG